MMGATSLHQRKSQLFAPTAQQCSRRLYFFRLSFLGLWTPEHQTCPENVPELWTVCVDSHPHHHMCRLHLHIHLQQTPSEGADCLQRELQLVGGCLQVSLHLACGCD